MSSIIASREKTKACFLIFFIFDAYFRLVELVLPCCIIITLVDDVTVFPKSFCLTRSSHIKDIQTYVELTLIVFENLILNV